jgi:hypothetical protein
MTSPLALLLAATCLGAQPKPAAPWGKPDIDSQAPVAPDESVRSLNARLRTRLAADYAGFSWEGERISAKSLAALGIPYYQDFRTLYVRAEDAADMAGHLAAAIRSKETRELGAVILCLGRLDHSNSPKNARTYVKVEPDGTISRAFTEIWEISQDDLEPVESSRRYKTIPAPEAAKFLRRELELWVEMRHRRENPILEGQIMDWKRFWERGPKDGDRKTLDYTFCKYGASRQDLEAGNDTPVRSFLLTGPDGNREFKSIRHAACLVPAPAPRFAVFSAKIEGDEHYSGDRDYHYIAGPDGTLLKAYVEPRGSAEVPLDLGQAAAGFQRELDFWLKGKERPERQ